MPSGSASTMADDGSAVANGNGSTAQLHASDSGTGCSSSSGGNNALLSRQASHDHTAYVARARVTRTAPPKPASNPLQFIQTKPFSLYKTQKEPVKRVEEVIKVKEVAKEEPEDWQSNLDNWKSCRRKRVEHIIDRVVEVKKLELEEHDRQRRKSKTFSEMMEERGSKGRKVSLAVYAEDDSNDLSDLGIGTSSASGKSSLSEDFDNHSVLSDTPDTDKALHPPPPQSQLHNATNIHIRPPGRDSSLHHHNEEDDEDDDHPNYISSPGGYETSSTAAASSPAPSLLSSPSSPPSIAHFGAPTVAPPPLSNKPRPIAPKPFGLLANPLAGYGTSALLTAAPHSASSAISTTSTSSLSKDSTPERSLEPVVAAVMSAPLQTQQTQPPPMAAPKRPPATKIEDRLLNFEIMGASQAEAERATRLDLPKVDVLKRRELFEREPQVSAAAVAANAERRRSSNGDLLKASASVKERLSHLAQRRDEEMVAVTAATTAVVNKSVVTPVVQVAKTPEPVAMEPTKVATDILDVATNGGENGVTADVVAVQPLAVEIEATVNEPIAAEVLQPAPVLLPPQPDVVPSSKPLPAARTAPIEPVLNSNPSSQSTTSSSSSNSSIVHNEHQHPDNDNDDEAGAADVDEDTSVIEALELAFKAIDTEQDDPADIAAATAAAAIEPIYENIDEIQELYAEIDQEAEQSAESVSLAVAEDADAAATVTAVEPPSTPPSEPYYQVPKAQPVPLYENIEIMYSAHNLKYPLSLTGTGSAVGASSSAPMMEPPKEKPPPPPPATSSDEEDGTADDDGDDDDDVATTASNYGDDSLNNDDEVPLSDPMRRMNSTRRIKTEIRNKRTSFLGIDDADAGDDVDGYLLLSSVVPPPSIAAFMQEELRLEKQLYRKQQQREAEALLSITTAATATFDSGSDTATETSRDSGVSDSQSHSRQSSEPALTTSSEEPDAVDAPQHRIMQTSCVAGGVADGGMAVAAGGDAETVAWEFAHDRFRAENQAIAERLTEEARMRCLEDQIREQEQVLRVERELLQLEQEQLRQQRDTLQLRESLTRRELAASMHNISATAAAQLGGSQVSLSLPSSSSGGGNQQHQALTLHSVQQQRQQQQRMYAPSEYRKSMPNLLQDMPAFGEYHAQSPPAVNGQHLHHHRQQQHAPLPPAKPLRAHHQHHHQHHQSQGIAPTVSAHGRQHSAPAIKAAQSVDDFVQLRQQHSPPQHLQHHHHNHNHHHHHQHQASSAGSSSSYSNLTKHALHALSATPKPKLQDGWVQHHQHQHHQPQVAVHQHQTPPTSSHHHHQHLHQHWAEQPRVSDAWLSAQQQHQQQQQQQLQQQQQKRRSEPAFNYNQHWLIQEAEQRRIDQQRGSRRSTAGAAVAAAAAAVGGGSMATTTSTMTTMTTTSSAAGTPSPPVGGAAVVIQRNGAADNKPLPEAVIQTLTQRVQSRGLLANGKRQSPVASEPIVTSIGASNGNINGTTNGGPHSGVSGADVNGNGNKEMLSISGKKKCSYCDDELGRGAAMIIESLRLFYHLDCFKCCVCRVQLGDGVSGADVRVRNQKLHCHNCFSSDDGIKFSCV